MAKKDLKDNMFQKSNEDRRRDFVDKNYSVAENVASAGLDKIDTEEDKSLKSLLKEKPKKIQSTVYLDERLHDFFDKLCKITGAKRSELINQLLLIAAENNEDIRLIASKNTQVAKILEEFIEQS